MESHDLQVKDDADVAALFQQREMEKNLAAHTAKMYKRLDPDFDGIHCIECDARIPKARLDFSRYETPLALNNRPHPTDKLSNGISIKLGTDKCVSCAEIEAQKQKQYQR